VPEAMPKRSRVRATAGAARAVNAIGGGCVQGSPAVVGYCDCWCTAALALAFGCAILAGLLIGFSGNAQKLSALCCGHVERKKEITVST
jgi:hypothetical protein